MSMETWTVLVVGVVLLVAESAQLDAPELRLHRYLFDLKRFDVAVRPRFNTSQPVVIDVTYRLRLIEQVLDKDQKIVISGWFDLTWNDDFLQWDPQSYGNITQIVVSSSRIWLPDVGVPQDKSKIFFSSEEFPVTLGSDGTITYSPGGTLTLPCKLQLRLYPFDTQNCAIVFSTWNSSPELITLNPVSLDSALDETNGEWNVTATSITTPPVGVPQDYAWIAFHIELRRKPINHIVGTLLPVFLLSVLNLMVFCLPPGSSETTNFAVTVLVALSVWLLMINDALPRSADSVPLTGIYVAASMIASTFSVFIVVISTGIFHKPSDQHLPHWVQGLVLSFEQIFHTKIPTHGGTGTTKQQPTWKDVTDMLVSISFYFLLAFQIIFSLVIGIMLAAA